MAITKLNSLAIPANTVVAADLSYPLTNFSSTGIDDNADATAITIDSSEQVGIGTASPSDKLHIYGGASGASAHSYTQLHVEHSSHAAIQLSTPNSAESAIFFSDPQSNSAGGVGYYHAQDYMYFRTGASTRLRVDADGIKFGSDTAAANALDDYEEGTWTPVMIGNGGTNPTVSYGNQTGYYTKVGNIVTVSWYSGTLNISNAGSGDAYISGLPYSSSTAVHHYPVGKVTFNTATSHVCDGAYLYDGTLRLMQAGLSSTLTTGTSGSNQYLMIGAVYRT